MGGMLGGMIAAHFWLGRAWALRIPPPELGMHLAMLAGMLAGMLPAMWVRDWVLGAVARRAPDEADGSPKETAAAAHRDR